MEYEHHEIEGIANLESVSFEQLEKALQSCDEQLRIVKKDRETLLRSLQSKESRFEDFLESMVGKYYRRKHGPEKHRHILRRLKPYRLESIVIYGNCIRTEREWFYDEDDVNHRMAEETEEEYQKRYDEVSLNMRNADKDFRSVEGMETHTINI